MSTPVRRNREIAKGMLEAVGVNWSQSQITRAVRAYELKAEPAGQPLHRFLAGLLIERGEQIRDPRTQRNWRPMTDEVRQFIELLMMPGNYAGRDHRKHGPHHVSGARRREGEPL